MKKFIALLSTVLLSVSLLSATPYDVKKFNSISASSIYDITLVKGQTCTVDIDASASLQQYISVTVVGHTLYLSVSPKALKLVGEKSNYLRAKITMPEIQSIDLGGSAKLRSDDSFFSKDEVEMEISGAAVVTGLDLNASRFDIEVSGAARLNSCLFDGRLVELESSGAAKVDCEIIATDASLDVSGAAGCKAVVHSTNLSIDASGASSTNVEVIDTLTKSFIESSGSAKVSISGSRVGGLTIEASGASTVKAGDIEAVNVKVEASAAAKVDVTAVDSLAVEARGASTVTYGLTKSTASVDVNASYAKVRQR